MDADAVAQVALERTGSASPTISVLMPVRNESGTVTDALDSLARQTYRHDLLEILLIDGRSADTTVAEAIAWSERHRDLRLRVLDNPRRLQAPALNLALRDATGDLVFIMSTAHGDLEPGYIAGLVPALGDDESRWVVGGHSEAVGRTPWGRAVARAIQSPAGLGAPAWRGSRRAADVDHVAYGLYRRTAFDRVGGFAEDLVINEDYDLTYRIRAAGGHVHLEPRFKARYLTRDTPGGLIRQYWTYGKYKVRMAARHPASVKLRHTVPVGFVLTLGALSIASSTSRTARRLLAGVGAVYGASVGLAAAVACRDEPRLVLGTAAAMVLMHTVYGAGELVGALEVSLGRARQEAVPLATCTVLYSNIPDAQSR